ncbi:RNA polymerase II-associated protein 3 isoform X2 [Nilaparvata lugens]|uniref:RNA polymerase II-associated protein 3 isoform X2 n=1 Tax=Nilaparvata lugens TaxID=108931 RepID=UPI00193CD96C|nr:RNA polymerase II-associated protein 3 isoform X2 [Nilaparvata lugens]
MSNDQESLSSNPLLMRKMLLDYNESYERETLDMKTWETEMKRKDKELLASAKTKSEWSDNAEKTDEANKMVLRSKANTEKEKGNAFVKQGKWDEAIAHYSKAMEYYSEDCTYSANRALCFLKTNRFREAEKDCTTTLSLDSKYVKAFLRRGAARMKLKKLDAARADLNTVLRLEPKNSEARRYLVDLEKESASNATNNESIHSEEDLTEEVRRKRAEDEKEKGNACVKERKWTEAIAHYTNAIEKHSEDCTFFANRALCYLKISRFEDAESDCSRSVSVDSSYVKAYLRRAAARIELKKFDDAKSDLNVVLKLEPNNSEAKTYLKKLKPCKGIEVIGSEVNNDDPPRIESQNQVEPHSNTYSRGTVEIDRIKQRPAKTDNSTPLKDNTNSQTSLNSPERSTSVSKKIHPPPKNSYQFFSAWNDLKGNPKDVFLYLKQIEGSQLPIILQNSLESGPLSSIVSILATEFIDNDVSAYPYLEGLMKVPRFDIMALLMSKEDKQGIEKIVQFSLRRREITEDQAAELKRTFHL